MNNLAIKPSRALEFYKSTGQFIGHNPHTMVNTKYVIINYLKNENRDIDCWDFISKSMSNQDLTEIKPHPLFDFKFYCQEAKIDFADFGSAISHFYFLGHKSGLKTSQLHAKFTERQIFRQFNIGYLDFYHLAGNYLMNGDFTDSRFAIDSDSLLNLKLKSDLYDFIVSRIFESSDESKRR